MTIPPHSAMVLAAGFGQRMRPLTLTTPKPLLPVRGRTMLDRALDALRAAGVARIVVNHHWLSDCLIRHCAGMTDVLLSDERDTVLETGGGVTRALPLLGNDPFYVCNGDVVWSDGPAGSALARLAAAWPAQGCDALLLLTPVAGAFGYEGVGDYHLTPVPEPSPGCAVPAVVSASDTSAALAMSARPCRRRDDPAAAYVFTGLQILHPRLFAGVSEHKFTLRDLYDRAEAAGRLRALVHDGGWYHIGTPEGLAAAQTAVPS